jgi:hypothetical protein
MLLPAALAEAYSTEHVAAAETPPDAAGPLDTLLRHFLDLRQEILEDLLERQTERVEALEAEALRLRERRSRLEESWKAQLDDVSAWRQEMESAEYTAEEKQQLEATKVAVDSEALTRLTRQKETLNDREEALRVKLARAVGRRRRLAEKAGLDMATR